MQKQSLFLKLTIVLTVLVAGTVLLCWVLSTTQLKGYYENERKKGLEEVYKYCDSVDASKESESEIYINEIDRLCIENNLSLLLLQADSKEVVFEYGNTAGMRKMCEGLLAGTDESEVKILKSTERYEIEKRYTKNSSQGFLLLSGRLSDGSLIFVRAALESLRASAQITMRFFTTVALFALIISIFVIMVVSRTISRPIRSLKNLSIRMTDLDFDAKYTPGRTDSRELVELGRNMNDMSESLEKVIAELKSANNQLETDIKRKEEIDALRREFISNVSHELKTPLALVSGYAEGLKEGMAEDKENRDYYCDVIIDESTKMNHMVRQLMNLSQLEFGADTVEINRFNLSELIQSVISSGSAVLSEKKKVDILFEEPEQYIWADEFKVEQVFNNFMTNAIHHVDGKGQIRVFYTKNGDKLRLSVFNSGKPIPQESIDRIWDKFYKVDKARTRMYGGNGIGLSIVKAIMDLHGQNCGAINHENGVEFWAEFDCELNK